MKIDGVRYSDHGHMICVKGSGDSKVEFFFTVLKCEGQEFWLLEEKGKHSLYGSPGRGGKNNANRYEYDKTHELFEANSRVHNARELGPTPLAWVSLKKPFPDVPAPFGGSREGLIVGKGPGAVVMVAIPLLEVDGDYYSPDYPGHEIPRRAVLPVLTSASGLKQVEILAAILAVVFALAALAGSGLALQAFWWLSPVASLFCYGTAKNTGFGRLARLISGAFFFHFCTRCIDVYLASDMDEAAGAVLEGWKVALLFAALWALCRWRPQIYFGIVDGSYLPGFCCWGILVIVMGVICNDEEYNYFPWFSTYAGELPWAFISLACGLGSVGYHAWNYRRAPVDLKGFRSLLLKTADILDKGLQVAPYRGRRLAAWADDLEDALSISCDAEVLSLTPFAKDFLSWRDQAKNLQHFSSFPNMVHPRLEEDLKAVGADIRELAEALGLTPERSVRFKSLRASPYLATWGQ